MAIGPARRELTPDLVNAPGNYTVFTRALADAPSVEELLKDPSANITVFVPFDTSAFYAGAASLVASLTLRLTPRSSIGRAPAKRLEPQCFDLERARKEPDAHRHPAAR